MPFQSPCFKPPESYVSKTLLFVCVNLSKPQVQAVMYPLLSYATNLSNPEAEVLVEEALKCWGVALAVEPAVAPQVRRARAALALPARAAALLAYQRAACDIAPPPVRLQVACVTAPALPACCPARSWWACLAT